MRKSLLLAGFLCLPVVDLFATPLRAGRREVQDVPSGSADAVLLGKALRAITLRDGSRVFLHLESRTWERNAVGATRVAAKGQRKTFWAENFFREESESTERPASGTVGQVYGATMLPDLDTLAMSIAWVDGRGKIHNGVGFWSLSRGPQKVVEFDGAVRDLAAVGERLVVAVTHVPSRGSPLTGWPLLTLLDTEGIVHGEFFRLSGGADSRTIEDSVTNSRLEQISDLRVAFYCDRDQTASEMAFPGLEPSLARAGAGSARNVVRATYEKPDTKAVIGRPVSLADGETVRSRILGFRVGSDGSVTAVKTVGGSRPGTSVLTYRRGEPRSEVWSTSTPWRLSFWGDADVVGVATRHDRVVLESVTLEESAR